jgi:hypothetical protein
MMRLRQRARRLRWRGWRRPGARGSNEGASLSCKVWWEPFRARVAHLLFAQAFLLYTCCITYRDST